MSHYLRRFFLFMLLMLGMSSAQAIDCGRAETVIENTICDSHELMWLDRVFTDSFRDVVVEDPQRINALTHHWTQARDACSSHTCLQHAYLNGIGQLYGVPENFAWQGTWWNTTATHGNGGKIVIHSTTDWGFKMDATIWGGIYRSSLSGNVNDLYGVGYSNELHWGGNCTVMLVPRADGKLEVSSDNHGSCTMLLPGKIAIDGVYVKADADPRPAASLLSLGLFPDPQLDARFRQLAGDEYQHYLDTATSFVYSQDLDSMGATVLRLWVKGMANQQAAMIMFTPEGKIWAMRVEPDKAHAGLSLHYITSEQDKMAIPKTLVNWRSAFITENE